MHIQFLSNAVASPQDVTLLFFRLAEAGVNVAAVGGSNLELGGKVAFAVADDDVQSVRDVMTENGYQFDEINADDDPRLTLCELTDDPGALHECLRLVTERNLAEGRVIRDIIVGLPRAAHTPGTIPVQVFSEIVRTPVNAVVTPPRDGGSAA